MDVCCVLSGRGLCDELIIRPEESYWLWCVWAWRMEQSFHFQSLLQNQHMTMVTSTHFFNTLLAHENCDRWL
jgi:hypothetical protein